MTRPRRAAAPTTVVVAMDSLKGSLDARQACAAVARGLQRACPDWHVVECPMADGGDGTADILRPSLGGRTVTVRAPGPFPDVDVSATYVLGDPLDATAPVRDCDLSGDPHRPDPKPNTPPVALLELAAVNGLTLLAPSERDPLRTSTRGMGVLMRDAVAHGARTLRLAIGGSATVDGGTGAARALGWRFLDADGHDVPEGGGGLAQIVRIVPPTHDPLAGVTVEVLCDVDAPLLGERGAARVFAPQKGATPEDVERLEQGLATLTARIADELGIDVGAVPGGGAAGGFGAGALAFFGARLVPGVDAVMDAIGLDAALAQADLVVTGEGRFDATSLRGKVVGGVLARARAADVPVAVVAGRVASGDAMADGAQSGQPRPGDAMAGGAAIARIEEAAPPDMPEAEAFAYAPALLEAAAARLAEWWITHKVDA